MSVAAFAGLAYAQPLSPQTLDAAIAAALSHSPLIVSARSRLDGSEAELVVSRSAGLPSVDGTIRYSRDLVQSQRPGNGLSLDAAVSVPLYRGGSVRNSVLAAESERDASAVSIGEVETEVILGITRAYANVLRDRQVVELNRANVRNLSTMLVGLRQRLSARDLTRTDLDQAESRLSLAHGRLEMAVSALEASEVEFHRLTGNRPGELAPFPGILGIPLTVDAAVEVAISENPGIIAARSGAQASRYSLNSAKGERLPQVFATVNSSFATSPSYTGPNSREQFGTSVGVSMRMNLFQGGKQGANERIAAAKVTQAEQLLLDLERSVEARTRSTYAEWTATRAVVEASKDAVRANDKALRGVRLENAVGTRTILEILNAEQELRDAQIQLLNAERDHAIANMAILAAIGKARAHKFEFVVPSPREPFELPPSTASLQTSAELGGSTITGPQQVGSVSEPAMAIKEQDQHRSARAAQVSADPPSKRLAASEWAVQLGAFGNLNAARRGLSAPVSAIAANLQSVRPAVFKATAAGRTLFRAALIGMDDWASAEAICLKLKDAGQTCLVRRSGQLGDAVWTGPVGQAD
jgi:outer membrane protein